MGRSNKVVVNEHRKYQHYQFYTTKGIERLLKDIKYLENRSIDHGDMAAVDILIDLEHAINLADLTDRQREIFYLVYIQDMKLAEAANRLGIDVSTASRIKKSMLKRILKVYKAWKYAEC